MPRASASLKHYCENGGRPLTVSANTLFAEDEGFASYVASEVERGVSKSNREGLVDVPQWVLSNPDWRFALGSFQLRWCLAGDDVTTRLSGVYDWHPDENRITRPVHEAAAKLKRNGAAAFSFSSSAEQIPRVRIKRFASRKWIASDRVYM